MKNLTSTKKIDDTLEHDQEPEEIDLKVFSSNHVNNKEDSETSDQEEEAAVVKKKTKRNANALASSKKLKTRRK